MTTDVHTSGFPWRWLGWGAAAALLAVPLVAMQFTREVQWTLLDFVVMGTLIGAVGLCFEFVASRSASFAYRAGGGLALLATFFLVWVNLAVGVIGSEDNAANLLFALVIATAIGGSIVAHFRAPGMAKAMLATAAVQVAVAGVALAGNMGADGPIWPRDLLGVTAILTTLWLAAALLFHRARK